MLHNINYNIQNYNSRFYKKSEMFLNDLKDNLILNLDEFAKLSQNPEEKIALLIKLSQEGDLKVIVNGIAMPLSITEQPMIVDGMVRTQIDDPQYKDELLKHAQKKHYSFKLMDPNRIFPPELEDTKKNFTRIQNIFNKQMEGGKLNKQDLAYLQTHNIEIEDLPMQLMIEDATIQSLEENYLKPAISLRISEDGEIGEIASIASQSPQLTGKDLMGAVDKFCLCLKVKKMFLEDDAKIEAANQGSYNLRLFRYVQGKDSWYADTFQFVPYEYDRLHQALVGSQASSNKDREEAMNQLTNKTVHEVLELLIDPSFDKSKYPKLIAFLESNPDQATIRSLIQDKGNLIMKNNAPLHLELSLLLTGYLETIATYRGDEDNKLKLKEQAQLLLNTKYFLKTYN
jgi:hypothetical protein